MNFTFCFKNIVHFVRWSKVNDDDHGDDECGRYNTTFVNQ